MDRLDDLLAASAPRVAPSRELDRVSGRVTRRPRAGLVIAGVTALTLAGGTAAIATDLPLDELINSMLNGQQNDHAWEMDITGVDGTFHCMGGIVVMPERGKSTFTEENYLAIKEFVQDHDWSDLAPDPTLMHDWQKGTAEQLAVSADRSMIEIAVEAGYSTDSISTQGTAQCEPK